MANNKTPEVRQNDGEAKELVVDARFIMRSYEKKQDDGSKSLVEYLSFEFINPFGDDEDFQDVQLKAKWEKHDAKTGRLTRPDRVFGWMSYYAKKALRTAQDFRVKATIKAVTYKSKRNGAMVTYPAIFVDPTFVELQDERPVEVVVKDVENANYFLLLAGNALGIRFSSREELNDEDIGLND